MNGERRPVSYAFLAALLYSLSTPLSKLLLVSMPAPLLASMLYFGAGFGMLLLRLTERSGKTGQKEALVGKADYLYILGMITLDVAAPILMLIGLSTITSANAALLSNFEIVATTIIASILFKEFVGRRMWLAIAIIAIASVILSVADASSFTFSTGSILVLLACVCWGLENNCTRMIAAKDPKQIVMIKGIGSGTIALLISLIAGIHHFPWFLLPVSLLLGFISYGLSIYFYVRAQRELGASRTSAYYASAPFLGVALSTVLYQQTLTLQFGIALLLMAFGSFLVFSEKHVHLHRHEPITHEHAHNHQDGHHTHHHTDGFQGWHNHPHTHEAMEHSHHHTPDTHHKHSHHQ